MKEIIATHGLVKNYYRNHNTSNPDARIEVLKGLDLSILEGEYVCIMGSSGGGKTTLLKILGMMESITDGEYYFQGKDVSKLWKDELADIRRKKIGFVFQDYYLMDSLSVEENIMVPMILDKAPADRMREKMHSLTKRFGVEKLIQKTPCELSGGEKQRVAICRALMNDPDIIMADEPTGNLDADTAEEITAILKESAHGFGKCVVVVTHSAVVANQADVVLEIKRGHLQERTLSALS